MPISATRARAGGFYLDFEPKQLKTHFGQHWRVLFGFGILAGGYYLVVLPVLRLKSRAGSILSEFVDRGLEGIIWF